MSEMKPKVVSATEFKAKCLSLIEQMKEDGAAITITKRGRPVAVLGPVRTTSLKSPKGIWNNRVRIQDDIANIDTSDLWDVVRK